MNVFINKIAEQSFSDETEWLNVQANSHAHRPPETLIYKYNGMNELIYKFNGISNLTWPILTWHIAQI